MVYQLMNKHTGESVDWNFHKYLVNAEGRAVKSYAAKVDPFDIEEDIVRLLDESQEKRMQIPVTH